MNQKTKYNFGINAEYNFGINADTFIPKWIAALRSGNYVQGAGELCIVSEFNDEPTEYCCLGVAGRIADMQDEDLGGMTMLHELSLDEVFTIPDALVSDGDNLYDILASLNDGNRISELDLRGFEDFLSKETYAELYELTKKSPSGWNFDKIADLVEELFTEGKTEKVL